MSTSPRADRRITLGSGARVRLMGVLTGRPTVSRGWLHSTTISSTDEHWFEICGSARLLRIVSMVC